MRDSWQTGGALLLAAFVAAPFVLMVILLSLDRMRRISAWLDRHIAVGWVVFAVLLITVVVT